MWSMNGSTLGPSPLHGTSSIPQIRALALKGFQAHCQTGFPENRERVTPPSGSRCHGLYQLHQAGGLDLGAAAHGEDATGEDW